MPTTQNKTGTTSAPSINQVAQMLRDVESAANAETRNTLVARLLGIMEAHPEMSMVGSYLLNEDQYGSALVCLLKVGEGLDTIQKFCNICPKLSILLNSHDSWGHYPLDWACALSTAQVIEYLVQSMDSPSYSPSLMSRNCLHFEPFQLAMMNPNGPIPTETMELLMQDNLCKYCPDEVTELGWKLALITEQPRSLLQAMEDAWSDHYEFPGNSTKNSFTITVPHQPTLPEQAWFSQCLQRCLRQNKTLQGLTRWMGNQRNAEAWGSLVRAALAGLDGNKTINKLFLKNEFYGGGGDYFDINFSFFRDASEYKMHFEDGTLAEDTDRPNQFLVAFLKAAPKEAITHLEVSHSRPLEEDAISVDAVIAFLDRANSLRSLELDLAVGWDYGSFKRFLGALQRNRTITKVRGGGCGGGIKMPEPSNPQEQAGLLQSLRECLENNNMLEELQLRVPGQQELWIGLVELLVEATLRGLDGHTSLKHICLRRIKSLKKISCTREEAGGIPYVDMNMEAPFAEELVGRIPAGWIRGLEVHGGLSDDFDVPQFLRRANNLQSLVCSEVGGADILNVVKEDHLKLTKCHPWSRENPNIEHYLALNYFGRAQTRNAGATRQHLLVLLLKVQQPWSSEFGAKFPHLMKCQSSGKLSMLYGLLREEPPLWMERRGV